MDYNPFSLDGKFILVIGASSGIGRQTAIECSKMGAKVAICARNNDALDETLSQLTGDGHQVYIVDLICQNDIERLVDALPEISGVVFSAGRGLTLPLKFATKEKFDEVFNVNFFSQVEVLRLLCKRKKISNGGSIVFVGSVGGVEVFNVGGGIYGASKAALNSTMKFFAMELSPQRIRVNSVNPGMTNTRFINRGTLSDDQFARDMQKYPLKRYGEPIDIALGIVYLLSDASSWVTGQSLCIDGGVSI